MMSGMKSSRRPAASSIPLKSILCAILFKILIHEPDDGAECIHCKFASDTKLEGVADMTEGHANTQRQPPPPCPGKMADRKFTKFNERQFKVLHLRKNNPIHCLILRATLLESGLAEKTWESWWTARWTKPSSVPLWQKGRVVFWAALGKGLPAVCRRGWKTSQKAGLREPGVLSLQDMPQVCISTCCRKSKEGRARFSGARGRAIGNGHKDIPTEHQEILFYCEGVWNGLPRDVVRYSKALWVRSWTTSSRWPWLKREGWQDEFQKSLSTWTIQWFCDLTYLSPLVFHKCWAFLNCVFAEKQYLLYLPDIPHWMW